MGPPRPQSLADDVELVRKLLAGDEAAFTATVREHHAGLRRFARLFVRDDATAEEVVQDTWVAALEGLAGFEGRTSLKGWLYRVLANVARTRAVREGRSTPFSALAEQAEAPGDPAVDPARFAPDGQWQLPPSRWDDDTPERLLARRESHQAVLAAIAALPETWRAVLTFRDIEGLSSAEVCNVLEISETHQRVLLHRARSRVRAALEAHLQGEK